MIAASPGRVPRLPRHLLARPALEAVLDDGAALTIVHGVQGYGKTTLLASWVARRTAEGLPTVWISATERLNDVAALDDALGASVADGTVVVVDDLHTIDDEAALHRLLHPLEESAGVRLVVSTRRAHPIASLAAGSIEMRIIHAHELTLSVGEIVELSATMGRPVDEPTAERLRAAVGGWMAAARIILEAASRDTPLPLAAARDYLSGKVLPSVENEHILAQLKRFSLVDRLDTRMVRDLAGDVDSDRLLNGIEEPGLLERRYRDDGVELRFPSLIRDILRDSFESKDPQGFRDAHREFALWFRRDTEWSAPMAAFEHAVRARDWELMKLVWADHASRFPMSFPKRYSEALAMIPEEIIDEERGMRVDAVSIAVVADELEGELDGATAWFRSYAEASFRAFAGPVDSLSFRDVLHFGAGQLIGLRMTGRVPEAVAVATRLATIVNERMSRGEYPGDRLGWFYAQVAVTHSSGGSEEAAVHFYKQAWDHGARLRLKPVEALAAGSLALIHASGGEPRQARHWLDRQRAVDTQGQWFHRLVAVAGDIAAAILCLDRLDADGYEDELARIEDADAALDSWQSLVWVRAQYALHFGDPMSALAVLDDDERIRRSRHGGDLSFPLGDRARTDLLIASGQAQAALELIGGRFEDALFAVPAARIRLLSGDTDAARTIAKDAARRGGMSARDRVELLLIEAVAARRAGDIDEARTTARRAFELRRSTGVLRAVSTVSHAERNELLALAESSLTDDELTRLDARAPVYPEALALVSLTDVECSLLEALDRGLSRKRIAETLFVSAGTVATQLRGLFEKLGVEGPDDALHVARRSGLLAPSRID